MLSIQSFIQKIKQKHYSNAFIQHLADVIDQKTNITTFQEIIEIIQKQSQIIINYFNSQSADLKLIQYRSSLCFQSLREYFHKMTRGIYKKYGNDISKFKIGLKSISKELIEILSNSTNKIVKQSQLLLRDNTSKKIMVYSYSKSISLSLKKLSKTLEENLQVYICKSGPLEEGIRLFQQLSLEKINCKLIHDNEIGYYISEVDCVIVGAQVILENGAILNRAGTYNIALIANQACVPFYVFAQSYKFIKKTYLSQKDIPQRYRYDKHDKTCSISIDLTPSKLITMFCMDSGLIRPDLVCLEISKILN